MTPISSYQFGDTELRNVYFAPDEVGVTIFNTVTLEEINIKMLKIDIFCMDTNISQNVIDEIYIISKDDIKNIDFVNDRVNSYQNYLSTFKGKISFDDKKMIYISPIAGSSVFVICEDFVIERKLG